MTTQRSWETTEDTSCRIEPIQSRPQRRNPDPPFAILEEPLHTSSGQGSWIGRVGNYLPEPRRGGCVTLEPVSTEIRPHVTSAVGKDRGNRILLSHITEVGDRKQLPGSGIE